MWLIVQLTHQLRILLPAEPFIWLGVGLIVGLNRGGAAVIKHAVLRLILWLRGYIPFRLVKFLDQSTNLVFLRKAGGSYIFVHRMLLEYFADLTSLRQDSQRIAKSK